VIPVYVANPLNPQEKAYVNALIDGGASRSSMSARLAKQIGIRYTHVEFHVRRFGDEVPVKLDGGYANAILTSYLNDLEASIRIQVLPDPIPNLTMPDWQTLSKQWPHLEKITFPALAQPLTIDLVIGNDLVNLVTVQMEVHMAIPTNQETMDLGAPIARRYPLGWAAQGTMNPPQGSSYTVRPWQQEVENKYMAIYDCATHKDIDRFDYLLPEESVYEERNRLLGYIQGFLEEQRTIRSVDHKEPVPLTKQEENVVRDWEQKVTFNGTRYSIHMPWKKGAPPDMNNRPLANCRHASLMKKFKKDGPEARAQFDTVIQGYESNGYISRVDDSLPDPPGTYYLPPFYVKGKTTTPIRPVFDAAAKYRGMCFNDYVWPGPCYVPDIRIQHLRFRQHKYALTGDIKAMFLQVELNKEDRDSTRFLWNDPKDNRDYVMRFNRWPFGVNASPAAASWTIRHHADVNKERFPLARKYVYDNTLVDDCLISVETEQELFNALKQLKGLYTSMGMEIHKFGSNNEKVMTTLKPEERAKSIILAGVNEGHRLDHMAPTIKTLGIGWIGATDVNVFSYTSPEPTTWTSRTVLSIYMGLFDPCGQILPFIILARKAFQLIRQLYPEWDTEIKGDALHDWQRWLDSLKDLPSIKIPRHITEHEGSQTVIVFCDASISAYGAVAYIRTAPTDGAPNEGGHNQPTRGVSVRQVMSQGKVTPPKKQTVPRLELEAAKMGINVAKIVLKAFPHLKQEEVEYFSDSQTVLKWLRMQSRLQDTFVGHRVSDIHSFSEPEQWHYVDTKENPADILSRGAYVAELAGNKLWFEGPEWLKEDKQHWPETPELPTTEAVKSGMNKKAEQYAYAFETLPVAHAFPPDIKEMVERSSTWAKACKILARVNRKKSNTKPMVTMLDPEELNNAEMELLRYAQAEAFPELWQTLGKNQKAPHHLYKRLNNPMMDHNNIIRIFGRLKSNKSLDEFARHPILLPETGVVTNKIVEHYHREELQHGAGLRSVRAAIAQKYHIIHGKKVIQQVLKNCPHCIRELAQERKLPFNRLPDARIQTPGEPPCAQVFRDVGIDFAGPYYTRQGRGRPKKKRWILLFVCMKTRALHLEMTPGESATDFINAMQRFISRRGTPAVFYCDNGTGFVKADKDLQQAFEDTRPDIMAHYANIAFRFNPAKAPNFGGHYERLVRCVKRALRSMMLSGGLNDDMFQTILCKAENIINARPLAIHLVGDSDDPLPITPDHFLMARLYKRLPEMKTSDFASLWRQGQRALELFWARFMREYVPELNKVRVKDGHSYNLEVGDIVCDVSDPMGKTPLGYWPLAIVVKTETSEDGIVRRAIIRRATTRRLSLRAAKFLTRIQAVDQASIERLTAMKILMPKDKTLSKEELEEIKAEAEENRKSHEAAVLKSLGIERELKTLAKSKTTQETEGVQTRASTKTNPKPGPSTKTKLPTLAKNNKADSASTPRRQSLRRS